MAERKVVGRKSQMFLHSVIPVINTHNDLVRKKLKRGKFPFTITGIIKLIGILFLLTAMLIFLSNSRCDDTPDWFPYLLPGVSGVHFVISFLLYLTFSLGLITSNPGTWVKIDIFTNLTISFATIIASVVTLLSCSGASSLQKVPMILGLCGGGISIISCASLFLLYRYTEDEDHEMIQHNPARPVDPRKSIFA